MASARVGGGGASLPPQGAGSLIPLLLWPAAGLGFIVAVLLLTVFVVRPALDHRHHARALANIARLERELGFDVPLEQRIDRELSPALPLITPPPWPDYAEQLAGDRSTRKPAKPWKPTPPAPSASSAASSARRR